MLKSFSLLIALAVLSALLTSCAGTSKGNNLQSCRDIAHKYKQVAGNNYNTFKDLVEAIRASNYVDRAPTPEEQQHLDTFDQEITKNEKQKAHATYLVAQNCMKILAQSPSQNSGDYRLLQQFSAQIALFYVGAEEKLFLSRTNGKRFCGNILQTLNEIPGIDPAKRPDKSCLYNLDQSYAGLTAIQVTKFGILAKPPNGGYPYISKNAFIAKGNRFDDETVDDMQIVPGTFEYRGILSYQSFVGERSVYSFKRVELGNVFQDILFYNGHDGVEDFKAQLAARFTFIAP